MEDYWRPVPIEDYATKYLVSRNGEVGSIKRDIVLSPSERNGYLSVCLSSHNDKTTYLIHRLVAMAFIATTTYDLVVNHKNGNRHDNRIENLEWTTQKENVHHALETGLSNPATKWVIQIKMDGYVIAIFDSVRAASEYTGIDHRHIPSVCRGTRNTAGGYVWRYYDDEDLPEEFDGQGIKCQGFPNYTVTPDGRVYSDKMKRYLKAKVHESGYLSVGLCNNGQKQEFYTHRLVASLYIQHVPGRDFVNHKNANKADNRMENLEWVSESENMQHANATVNFAHRKAVSQYTMTGVLVSTYDSVKVAKERTGIDNSSIVRCCKGKAKHAGNFLWQYV